MESILSAFRQIALFPLEAIVRFIQVIINNPYLLIGVSLMLLGAGVSFLKRLIRV